VNDELERMWKETVKAREGTVPTFSLRYWWKARKYQSE
jgi:hypothetical protein